jgi:adenylate cyclase
MKETEIFKHKLYLAVIIIVFAAAYFLPTNQRLELFTYDLRSTLCSLLYSEPEAMSSKFVIVALDEPSIKAVGGIPLSPRTSARFINRAEELGASAAVIGVPIRTAKQVSKEGMELIRAMSSSFPVFLVSFILPQPMSLTPYNIMLPAESFNKYAAGIGFANVDPDFDGVCRKGKLYTVVGGKIYDSLALCLAKYLKHNGGGVAYFNNRLLLGSKTFYTDADKNIIASYRHLHLKNALQTVSLSNFLNPRNNFNLDSKVVYLALTTLGYYDEYRVPNLFERRLNSAYIHLNLLENLLTGKYIYKVPGWVELFLLIIIGILCGSILLKHKNLYGILVAFTVLAVFLLLNLLSFFVGIWFNLAAAVMAVIVCVAGFSAYFMVMRLLKAHNILKQFVHTELIDELLQHEEAGALGIKEKEVTILFADIKGYTTLAERKSPKEVIEILNEYYVDMAKILASNYGRVYNYQGDAVMVVFEKAGENNAFLAIKAAYEMQEAFDYMRRKWQLDQRELFIVGIGICSGQVALGVLGTQEFRQYVAIGDAVNIASRLEDLSKQHRRPLVIAESTYNEAKEYLQAELIDKLHLKGKFQALDVYAVKSFKLENGVEVKIEDSGRLQQD